MGLRALEALCMGSGQIRTNGVPGLADVPAGFWRDMSHGHSCGWQCLSPRFGSNPPQSHLSAEAQKGEARFSMSHNPAAPRSQAIFPPEGKQIYLLPQDTAVPREAQMNPKSVS